MSNRLLGVLGRIVMTDPERFIGFWERLALENPDECALKWWVVPLARLEGLVLVSVAGRETPDTQLKRLLGPFGLILLLFPEQYADWGTKLAYENPDRCEWKSWVIPFTRIIGALYVLLGVRGLRDRWR
jgi:hypothetical protein